MRSTARRFAILAFLALTGPLLANEVRPDVSDRADLFSKKTKEEVEPIFKDIHKLGKDFLVETFSKAPEAIPADGKERSAFFDRWARERASTQKVNGVYLLIYKNADVGRFEVVVGDKTREKAFTEDNRKELRTRLETALQAKEYDSALLESATFVRDRMRTNLGNKAATTTDGTSYLGTDSGWMRYVWIGLAVLLGIWLLRAIFVAISGMSGGGGFFTGLMGGLFGAMAGMWIYDSFMNSNWGGGGGETGGDTTGGSDTDYTSEGGDLGDGGGGGGGDGGGGDF